MQHMTLLIRHFAIGSTLLLAASASQAQTPAQTPAQTQTQTRTQTQPLVPPVAGSSTLGVSVTELESIVTGWSVKRELMGKTVRNEQRESIGKIEDIIISLSKDTKQPVITTAIIGVGGFLGIGARDVAIPMTQLRLEGRDLILPGATRDTLRAMPAFQYARK